MGVASPGAFEEFVAGFLRDRMQRVVVDFRAGDDRDHLVEQVDELPKHACLRLTAKAEQKHVVLLKDRCFGSGTTVSSYPSVRKQRLAALDWRRGSVAVRP